MTVIPPRLTIRALVEGCVVAPGWFDRIYADGHLIGHIITGLKFAIPCQLLEDGRVTIDIRMCWICVPGWGRRGIKVDWAKLEWGCLVVEIRPMVGEVPDDETLEMIREWLRQQGIDREDIGELPEIWVWRTVSRIKDGDGFFVEEPIARGRWRDIYEVRIKGLDTPEERRLWGRYCANQYHHAAVATSQLRGLIPPGTIVRIESYYPFELCRIGLVRLRRIQGSVFRAIGIGGLDIAKSMIRGGYGVAAMVCVIFDRSAWEHPIGRERARELQSAQQAAKEAQKGIWNDAPPLGRLLLHPGYYRWWRWSPALPLVHRITRSEAVALSRRRLSHAK